MSRQPRRSTSKQQKRKRKARVSARLPASAMETAGSRTARGTTSSDLTVLGHLPQGGRRHVPLQSACDGNDRLSHSHGTAPANHPPNKQHPLESPPADAVFYILSRNPAKPRPPSMDGGACVTSAGLRRRSPPLASMSEGASMGEAGRPQGSPARARPTQPPSPAGKVSRRKP